MLALLSRKLNGNESGTVTQGQQIVASDKKSVGVIV
jgi:hypothetical protein